MKIILSVFFGPKQNIIRQKAKIFEIFLKSKKENPPLTNNDAWINFITVQTHSESLIVSLGHVHSGETSGNSRFNVESPLQIDTGGTIC